MTKPLIADIDTAPAKAAIEGIARQLDGAGARELFRSLALMLEQETETNFERQGRPSWVPLKAATIAEKQKRNKHSSVLKVLQDSSMLASNIVTYHDESMAQVGANRAYAAIHQYGGTINRPAHSVKVRLRKDAKGRLDRQGSLGKSVDSRIAGGAVFAGNRHTRVIEKWATVEAYKIDIPSRPYLPFSGPPGGEVLQPETEQSVLDLLQRHVLRAVGG